MPPPLRRATATIAARAGGALRLAAVADTHSRPHPAVAAQLAAWRPDAILHAGDIGERAVLDELATIAPVLAVRGNIDARAADLPDVLVIDVTGERPLRLLLTHIAIAGVRLRADVARLARAAGASLVVCGHSHVPFISEDRGLVVFNPGSSGPRRFHLPIVHGTIELGAGGVRLAHVDAETGRAWTPPAA
ncbi:MAG: YfcE family phosphodiesterase [Myxococcales bacterium]|nr:YfcE family phosphodiesterase [Myxococcales bacterium]